MRFLFTLILIASFISLSAQTKKEKDAIKDLCGCFQITFKYAETFSPYSGYKFPDKYYAEGVEWVTPVEQSDKKFVLQHLLLIDDSTIIKHWREDWEYEKKDLWLFQRDATWKHVDNNNTKGEWTQTVWEVDDAPRYQGSSKWIDNNGQYYWENTSDAPLPRREYSKRSDYNVMKRTNKIIMTDSGWTHEQDNDKIIRYDTADVLIAQEKGYNIYHKVPDSQCAFAASWWKGHEAFWTVVRNTWNDLMKGKQDFHLTSKVDGQLLYEQLDKLEDEKIPADQLKTKITTLINEYASAQKKSSTVVQSK